LKLLFDQNISRKVVPPIEKAFPGTSHVYLLGLDRATDSEIWYYARHHEFTIVTKNTDMVDLCVLRGAPPHVVWLRLGNCTTALVRTVLSRDEERIRRLPESGRIVLSLFALSSVDEAV